MSARPVIEVKPVPDAPAERRWVATISLPKDIKWSSGVTIPPSVSTDPEALPYVMGVSFSAEMALAKAFEQVGRAVIALHATGASPA
jgi:hypothetical protein